MGQRSRGRWHDSPRTAVFFLADVGRDVAAGRRHHGLRGDRSQGRQLKTPRCTEECVSGATPVVIAGVWPKGFAYSLFRVAFIRRGEAPHEAADAHQMKTADGQRTTQPLSSPRNCASDARCLPFSSKLSSASQRSNARRMRGQSRSMIAYHAVSRLRPL